MDASVRCTRVALGEQIRRALDEMQQDGRVCRWSSSCDEQTGIRYVVTTPATESLDATSMPLTPSEVADWLNVRGFDVYIGKAV